MSTKTNLMAEDLKEMVQDLIVEYSKLSELFKGAGLDAKLKEGSLQGMANITQLMQVTIQNYANWKHIMREDKKVNK